ncbi:hypothetical protein [Psychroserpens jangbogonensis]|uniref:hypothetical protein n=1 Tax=Psychroserpens jangbogonensis TaxID=1484460 RepID=UPI00053EAB9F|nr:hypothetical protein [Psychroserpens jangbogonensis]
MTRLLTILCLLTILTACKSETKDQTTEAETASEEKKELTTAEKIAKAHGFDNWKNVNEIKFTFNVDRGENHFERSWTWNPKIDNVRLVSKKDTINFNRKSMDSVSMKTDRAFINDKFWMLIPFQLVWDEGTTFSEAIKEITPISKTELNKITLTYGNEGGYTPGDAYDIYYDDDYIIKEWVFREGNSKEPSMTTTFENHEDFNGIKIAKDHKMAEGNFNLYFSNITVK